MMVQCDTGVRDKCPIIVTIQMHRCICAQPGVRPPPLHLRGANTTIDAVVFRFGGRVSLALVRVGVVL